MANPTLEQRQAQLRAELAAKKAEASRLALNKRQREQYRENKTHWHEKRTKAQLKRAAVEARKKARLEKKRIKEEAKRKRMEARKRKFKDPVKDAARIYAQGFEDGKNWLIRSGEYVKRS